MALQYILIYCRSFLLIYFFGGGLSLIGKIRVYCRIRPFLPGQTGKQSTVEYIGDDGELVIANPSKQGKEGHRMFKFNKVFGPAASQGFCLYTCYLCIYLFALLFSLKLHEYRHMYLKLSLVHSGQF